MLFAMLALPTLISLQASIPSAGHGKCSRPLGEECAHMPLSLPDLLMPTGAHFNADLLLILRMNTEL